jgi:hypothetical protein
MNFKFWTVFFINSEGNREGKEVISALTRDEAISLYRRFFNVRDVDVVALPHWGKIAYR